MNSLRELVSVFDKESRLNKLPITSSLKQTLNKLRTEVDPTKVIKHMKGIITPRPAVTILDID